MYRNKRKNRFCISFRRHNDTKVTENDVVSKQHRHENEYLKTWRTKNSHVGSPKSPVAAVQIQFKFLAVHKMRLYDVVVVYNIQLRDTHTHTKINA